MFIKNLLNSFSTLGFFLFLSIFHNLNGLAPSKCEKLSTISSKIVNLHFERQSKLFFTLDEQNDLSFYVNTKIKRGFFIKNFNLDNQSRFTDSKFIQGSTIILMEKPETNFFFTHYFHFLEHLLHLWENIKSNNFPEIKLFLIAGDGNQMDFSWKGQNNITEILIRALFPKADILTLQDFISIKKENFITFENAIISDRAMEFYSKEPFYMARMLNLYYQNLNKTHLDNLVLKVKNYLQITSPTHYKNEIDVTYIVRNTIRFVDPNVENTLLEAISSLPNVKLKAVDFAKIPFKDQIDLIDKTDILIGAHGNGFSNTLFLNPYSTVIELFPKHSLRCEYRVFSNLRDSNYYAWIDNEGLFDYNSLKGASEKGRTGVAGDKNLYIIKPHIKQIVDLIEKEVKKRLQ